MIFIEIFSLPFVVSVRKQSARTDVGERKTKREESPQEFSIPKYVVVL